MRRAAIIGLLLGAGHPPAASAEDALQPYQLVRSLQLVRTHRSGDHCRLAVAGQAARNGRHKASRGRAEDFKDPKNFRALLVLA